MLWAKSLLNALLFFAIFMLALPWLAHQLLPAELPVPARLRIWLAGPLALVGVCAWIACLDSFSRHCFGGLARLAESCKAATHMFKSSSQKNTGAGAQSINAFGPDFRNNPGVGKHPGRLSDHAVSNMSR